MTSGGGRSPLPPKVRTQRCILAPVIRPGTVPDPLQIAVIRGDGIGPELVSSALEILDAVASAEGFGVDVREEPGGADHYQTTGQPLADGALARLRAAHGVLKGPVGLPDVRRPDGTIIRP